MRFLTVALFDNEEYFLVDFLSKGKDRRDVD